MTESEKERLRELERTVSDLKKQVKKGSKRIDNIEIDKVSKFLEESKEDAITVHNSYRLLIMKQFVGSSLVWIASKKDDDVLAGKLAVEVFRAFDKPALWWNTKEKLNLAQWQDLLLAEVERD